MLIIPSSNCIRCYFSNDSGNKSNYTSTKVEVFYAETENLDSRFSYLKKYITNDEQLRADRFYSDTDRKTYISCHALLRLILGARLNIHPLKVSFIKGIHDKPGLSGNQEFFNIAHTREAFAIAFVRDFHVGIDLEKINQRIDIESIIKTYFSKKEQNFILKSKAEAINSFFQLWTRKEALLKALGTGMINDLHQVNVSEPVNFMKKDSFDNLVHESVLKQYFIYSLKLGDYFISVAIPQKSSITFYNLNEDNISAHLA